MINQEFFHMDDRQLIFKSIEPVIARTRGKSPEEKMTVFQHLDQGSRALYMIQVMIGHMEFGSAEFFEHIEYLAKRTDLFTAFKSAMRFFNEEDMLNLVYKMEECYTARDAQHADPAALHEIDCMYLNLLPHALKRIADRIRSNPAEFTGMNASHV